MTREELANAADVDLVGFADEAVAFLERGVLYTHSRLTSGAPYDVAVRVLVEVARRWCNEWAAGVADERWTLVDDRVVV